MSEAIINGAGGMPFLLWLQRLGKSRATGDRWRKKGIVKTENIEGIHYISQEESNRFWGRAKAGAFRKLPRGACKRGGLIDGDGI